MQNAVMCYSNAESMQNDQVHYDKQYMTC